MRPSRIPIGLTLLAALACDATPRTAPHSASHPPNGDFRGELTIDSRPSALAATPRGRLWLGTMMGMFYTADSVRGDWRSFGEARVDTVTISGTSAPFEIDRGSIDGIAFADDRHGIAWGTIRGPGGYSESGEDSCYVYVTENAGNDWRLVRVGAAFTLDVGRIMPSGEAWVLGYRSSTSTGDEPPLALFESRDFGMSWAPAPAPTTSSPPAALSFASPRDALLAAMDDRLFLTHDRGARWRAIPTPLTQKRYTRTGNDPFARIGQAVYADGWLVVEQDGHTFRSRPDPVSWERWPTDTLLFVDTDRATGRLCGVDARLRYVRFDASLVAHPVDAPPLLAPPVAAECRDGRLRAMDTDYRIYDVGDGGMAQSFPLTSGRMRASVDGMRLSNGVRWGATQHYLYTWDDSAHAWFRLGYGASGIRGFLSRNATEALVWDGHGVNAIIDRRTGAGIVVPSLRGDDVAGVMQLDSLWLAWGGKQYETSFRVEVAQTFFAGEFRGSRPDGFVLVSRDSGRSWEEIDHWPGGGVSALHASPDASRIMLVSYIGSVRELSRAGAGWSARDLVVATPRNTGSVPYVQWPAAFYFDDARVGYLTGGIHHVGGRAFTTTDGGRSWTRAAVESFPYRDLIPWKGGYVGHTNGRIVHLVGASRTVVADLSASIADGDDSITEMSRVGTTDSVLVVVARHGQRYARAVIDLHSGRMRMLPEGP